MALLKSVGFSGLKIFPRMRNPVCLIVSKSKLKGRSFVEGPSVLCQKSCNIAKLSNRSKRIGCFIRQFKPARGRPVK